MKFTGKFDLCDITWICEEIQYSRFGMGIRINLRADDEIFNYKFLFALSEYFGTQDIDIDHYSQEEDHDTFGNFTVGEYIDIDIYNITKNMPEMTEE